MFRLATPEPPRIEWGWWLMGTAVLACTRTFWRLVWAMVSHPVRLVWLAALVAGVIVYGEHPAVLFAVLGAGAVGVGVWAWRWPASFRRQVAWRLRGRWRALSYRRWWLAALGGAGLDGPDLRRGRAGGRVYPRRSAILASPFADHFRVRMLPGQTVTDWINAGPQLATTLGVQEVRVRPAAPGRWSKKAPRLVVEVTAIRRDALADTIDLPTPADVPDLTGLPVATTEDGDAYRLRLLGHHVLIGGATGAGKGSVLWSLIVSLAPGVRSGLVRLYGVDPKSLEFPYGERLFTEVIDGRAEAMADALEHFVEVMERRKAQMRGVSRLHTPTTAEPLIVVIVDELAALTSYTADPKIKKRIETSLGLLLSQGRAMAISVVAAAQDPRKEVLSQRALFTTRIGMRLNEAGDVDMLLGSGARARGALCDQIGTDIAGVAYVMRDGATTATRVRFPWVSDDAIRDAANKYGPGSAPSAPMPDPDSPDDDGDTTGAEVVAGAGVSS